MVGSSPHPEEIEAAGAEPAQGHLLHVEQAQDRLDQAEEEDIDVDLNIDIDISKSSTWTRQWWKVLMLILIFSKPGPGRG